MSRGWFGSHREDKFEQEERSRLLAPVADEEAPTRQFQGVSDLGVMPKPGTLAQYAPTEQIPAVRASGPMAALQTSGPFPAVRVSGPQRRLRPVPPPPELDVLGLPAQKPAVHLDPRTPVLDDIARGWGRMFTIACEYDAAEHQSPIPCDTIHRDPEAATFPALKESAWDAGWRMDDMGRWACPDHVATPAYRTPFHLTFWAPGAHEARRKGAVVDILDTGGYPVITADGITRTVPGEFVLRVRAEQQARERTIAAVRQSRHGKAVAS